MATETKDNISHPPEITQAGGFVYAEKVIDGFPNYAISNTGKVISLSRRAASINGTRLVPRKELYGSPDNKGGYLTVSLYSELNYNKSRKIHRLVADHFLGPKPGPDYCVNHKDGNKTNNRVDNLEWVTYLENNLHTINVLGKEPTRLYDMTNANCKRTPQLVAKVKAMISGGFGYREIARELKITHTLVRTILTRSNNA